MSEHQGEVEGQMSLFEFPDVQQRRLEKLQAEKLDELCASNNVRRASLAKRNISLNAHTLLHARLETLIEMMDGNRRKDFEILYETKIGALLDSLLQPKREQQKD